MEDAKDAVSFAVNLVFISVWIGQLAVRYNPDLSKALIIVSQASVDLCANTMQAIPSGLKTRWISSNALVLQRHIDFKRFRLGDRFLPVRDMCNMVMMSVIFDNLYDSFQSQRIQ